MGIVKNYSRSIHSSNLKSDALHFDADNLAAVALSSDLGNLLFRVKYGSDATSYKTLLAAWRVKVDKKAGLRHWPRHIIAGKIAETSLTHWLNDVCKSCEGRGYEKMPGAPVLSDTPCKTCDGHGKRPLVCDARARDYVLDMVEDLEEMTRSAAGRAMAKLASDMDL